ncbi:MAG: hypothetical protein NTW96_04625 [Planctomycetia bacterium]|nr:hypothetical protein [Planctomycetia bacterium]
MTKDQAQLTKAGPIGRAARRVGSGRCIAPVVVAVVAAATLAGCAGPGGVSGLARRGDEQALREAVATDRFPTAAELGIGAGKTAKTRQPAVQP